MISCKTCNKQYTGISEGFISRFNNYKCAHRDYCKNMKVKQESFSGESDWEVGLIDQSDNTEDLRKTASLW